jgi:steroid delta-isomerase-like uncharacterized protein
MTGAEAKAQIRAHYDAVINWFEPDAIRAQIPDGYLDHGSGRMVSAEAVIAYAQELHSNFAELSVIIYEMIAEGDRVAVRENWRGVHAGPFHGLAATGKRFSWTGMVFWRLRCGKIAERWPEIDSRRLLAHLRGTPRAA